MTRISYSSKKIIEIGKRVKESRIHKGYSQKELADRLNLKKDVIRRIEAAQLQTIDPELITRIANCLQCNSDYLLLKTDAYFSTISGIDYRSYPNMQKTVDGFVYGHMPLYHDLSYIAQYMHEDYQKEILDLIHTMVTFHKIAVQFPNTTPLEANKLSFDGAFQKIKQNFFDIPNPHKGELHRVQMRRIPHVTKCLFKITSIPQHIIKNRRWVKVADDN